jgi:hypothetical protein
MIGHLIKRKNEIADILDDVVHHNFHGTEFSDLILEEHRLISQITEFDNENR